ncbi:hypothetical protein CDAR_311871 [Caerostris darwini]|uniref:G-protein coupled receptors family 1 profile domain-containing protein n=1 Tax=Caerostris darwini TaxID=1538125 RepID=A0AAV4QW63_9ARAC|nr:hypothetical protein CDAR_311871 [Caerostris darwini]
MSLREDCTRIGAGQYMAVVTIEDPITSALTQEYRKCPCHRRGDIAYVARARDRAYRMMITTSLTFVLFLIPYKNGITVVWYLSQPVSAKNMESNIQSFFLMFSVTISCINPLIYGSYVFNFKKLSYEKTTPKTRITAPANRFNETSHLKVSVIPTANSLITCPVSTA